LVIAHQYSTDNPFAAWGIALQNRNYGTLALPCS
jgi:hypothetical protein